MIVMLVCPGSSVVACQFQIATKMYIQLVATFDDGGYFSIWTACICCGYSMQFAPVGMVLDSAWKFGHKKASTLFDFQLPIAAVAQTLASWPDRAVIMFVSVYPYHIVMQLPL